MYRREEAGDCETWGERPLADGGLRRCWLAGEPGAGFGRGFTGRADRQVRGQTP